MSLSADEVNVLIARHLQESGFHHTAFMFSAEAMLEETNFRDIDLPPQAMITILKKGMLYMQLEKGINERARTEDSADHIITSIIDSVKRKEALQPARQPARPRSAQAPVPTSATPPPEPTEIRPGAALELPTHKADVYCGAWSPDGQRLATGSRDATAIIWEIGEEGYINHYLLDHATQQARQGKDIVTLSWNASGTILATGCYDGSARLWTNRGELKSVLVKHTDAIFTVQFSPDGQYLLTGAADAKIIMWTVATGEVRQVFSDHEGRVLDLDWRDNTTFASCSGDSKICVYTVGQQKAVFVLSGHTEEINKIEWDPSRRMLASCSDDTTVRVWRPFDRTAPVILHGHTNNVYTIKWAPGSQKILVSGAFDSTVRVWDVQNRTCLHVLSRHKNAIYTIAFSPRGRFFASGGIDNTLMVWRTSDAALIATFKTNGGLFEAAWDVTGANIALCLSDSNTVILPTKNIPLYDE